MIQIPRKSAYIYIYIYTPSQPSFSSTSSLELENVKTCSRSDANYKVDVAMYQWSNATENMTFSVTYYLELCNVIIVGWNFTIPDDELDHQSLDEYCKCFVLG